jgi:hypothetical protein
MPGGYRNQYETGRELTEEELLWLQTAATGILLLEEQAIAPAATTDVGKIYVKTDGLPYYKGDDGVERSLTGTYYTDEAAQDAVGNILADSFSVDFTYDDAGGSISAAVRRDSAGSFISGAGGIKLDGDAATPGNTKFYGTDGTGVKGWQDFVSAADARITAQKGVASGLATLGSDSKIPSSQLPAIALTDVHVVASEVAQLALTVEEGDIAVRTDIEKTYIHNGGTAGTMADWTEMLSPTGAGAVSSVNGYTGAVVLTTTDITEGTNLYYTNTRADARIAAAAATGSGSLVRATSPTLVTPALGVASATSLTSTGAIAVGTTLKVGSGTLGTYANLGVFGSSAARVSIEVQNTNAGGNASFYFQNDRGTFQTYGGLLTGGSADVGGTLFGLARADRTFLISDGTSSLGLAVGTLTNHPLVFGTNGVERMRIAGAGETTFAADVLVPDEVYGAGWDASLEVPTKNALYDKIEGVIAAAQPIDADLTAIAALGATAGSLHKTAADTWAVRTLTGTSNQITVTNGDGVSGNPTLSIPSLLQTPGAVLVGSAQATTTSANAQILSSTGSQYSLSTLGAAATGTVGYNVFDVLIRQSTFTEAASGTHNLIASVGVRAPVITNGVGATTNAATVYIEGAPSGTATPTNVYALFVDAGVVRFDGTVVTEEFDNGSSSTADTIDWSLGNHQKSSVSASCTYTFTAPPKPCVLSLKLIYGGAFTPTFPATVKWPGGTTPTWTAASGKTDLISLRWDGTNYHATSSLNYTT